MTGQVGVFFIQTETRRPTIFGSCKDAYLQMLSRDQLTTLMKDHDKKVSSPSFPGTGEHDAYQLKNADYERVDYIVHLQDFH